MNWKKLIFDKYLIFWKSTIVIYFVLLCSNSLTDFLSALIRIITVFQMYAIFFLIKCRKYEINTKTILSKYTNAEVHEFIMRNGCIEMVA